MCLPTSSAERLGSISASAFDRVFLSRVDPCKCESPELKALLLTNHAENGEGTVREHKQLHHWRSILKGSFVVLQLHELLAGSIPVIVSLCIALIPPSRPLHQQELLGDNSAEERKSRVWCTSNRATTAKSILDQFGCLYYDWLD